MGVSRPYIGKMRQVVKMERNEPVPLGAGMKDNYVEWVSTRGLLQKMSGFRALTFGEANIENRWELFIRYQQEVENYISKSMKLIINNMFFTVETYSLIDEKQRYYHLVLNEKR